MVSHYEQSAQYWRNRRSWAECFIKTDKVRRKVVRRLELKIKLAEMKEKYKENFRIQYQRELNLKWKEESKDPLEIIIPYPYDNCEQEFCKACLYGDFCPISLK